MKRRNNNYLVDIYKGTTFLRLFLFLSIGVLLVNSVGVAPLWMMLLGCFAVLTIVMGVLLACRNNKYADIALTVGFVCIALSFGGLWSLRESPAVYEDGVMSIEIVSSQKGGGNHLSCDASLADGGLIRLNSDSSLSLRLGEKIDADLRVYWPRYRGGEFNYPLYLYRKGYSGVAWLDSSRIVSRGESTGWSIALWRQRCVRRYADAGVSDVNIGLLSAITVGERSALGEDVSRSFRDAGVAHVLVVSGMHVGFIFLLINLCYRRWKKHRPLIVLTGIIIMWCYAALVGFTAPVCRATLMFSLMLLFGLTYFEYNSLNALSLAAVVLMILNPLTLYDVGFQLSFLAVFSIIIFYPAIPPLSCRLRGVSMLWDAARLSLSAQMLVLPLIIYYFGQIPLYFLLTNVLLTFLTPVVFLCGIVTLIPYLGLLTGRLLDIIVTLFRMIVEWVASLPGATIEMESGSLLMIFSLMIIFIIGCILRSPK